MLRRRGWALIALLVVPAVGMVVLFEHPYLANPYSWRQVHVCMAGSGDPWPLLTRERRLFLRSLHDDSSRKRAEEVVTWSRARTLAELGTLERAHLVNVRQGRYRPAFFIANREQADETLSHATTTGRVLARDLLSRWEELEESYAGLELSRSRPLAETGFILVGGRMLDIGVLGALVVDGTLLPPPPLRPTPARPDGRYYLWMVEGDYEHLGRYGQDETDLPGANWHLVTFAQNIVSWRSNPARRSLDNRYQRLIEEIPDASPEAIAADLDVLFMSREDSRLWGTVAASFSTDLVATLKRLGPEIRRFYAGLDGGWSSEESFGEFFVWYYHLAFSSAIDTLAEQGVITIPRDRCSAVILYREGKEGVLEGF